MSCKTGKRRFATDQLARAELVGALIAKNRGKNQRRERRIYECPACRGWHLTSLA